MATEALKSTSVTNLDASPIVANTQGEGAPALIHEVEDYVTTTSAVTTGSTYRVVRIPSNAVIKDVILETEAMGGSSAADLGLYYSDSYTDGTKSSNRAAVIDADFFGSAVSLASALVKASVVNEGGFYTLALRKQPIWQAAGLAADPGGFFDVVLTSTATITTGARVGVAVKFVK